jgi:hypothetical protein
MVPWLPVSSILQCNEIGDEAACEESFGEIGCFELTFINPHQESIMICKVRSLKRQISTRSIFDYIVT